MRSFCTNQFEAKSQQLGVTDKVIASTCNEAVDVIDAIPESSRLDPMHAAKISTGFCSATRKFFIQEVKSQDPEGVGPSLGVAHSFSDIMSLTGNKEAKAHTGCCVTHDGQGTAVFFLLRFFFWLAFLETNIKRFFLLVQFLLLILLGCFDKAIEMCVCQGILGNGTSRGGYTCSVFFFILTDH